jgi:hypothetical protein
VYRATLNGDTIATGTMQQIQTAAAIAATDMGAEDPEGTAHSVMQANADFQTGRVSAAVKDRGRWECPFWVHGAVSTLVVTEDGGA